MGKQRSNFNLSRRALFPAAILASPTSPLPQNLSATDLCVDWLRADARLEAATLEWSRVEAGILEVADLGTLASSRQLRRLERRIRALDQKRSGLLERIVERPVQNIEEVLAKLLVAKRLLEGEGGAEHDLVADAATGLANSTGL